MTNQNTEGTAEVPDTVSVTIRLPGHQTPNLRTVKGESKISDIQ